MFNARIHHTSGKLRTGLLIGAAAALSLFAATGAQAQNCSFGAPSSFPSVASSAASVSSVIASTLATASTAFLLQSTAFVGAPGNPAPDQQGGGVWVRGVGGEVEAKKNS